MKTNIIAPALAPHSARQAAPSSDRDGRTFRTQRPLSSHPPGVHLREERKVTSTGHLYQPLLVATLTTTGHDANQYWLLTPPCANSLPHTEQRLIGSCITDLSIPTMGASKAG